MLATDVLRGEHRVIEQVVACLEKLADSCKVQGKLDRTSARQAIDFFQTFADRCHHHKEEAHLFPLLEARGFPPSSGPTSVMRAEHDLGRRLLRDVVNAIDAAAAGEPDAAQRFVGNALAYAHLLREHIAKEDQRLFPMTDEALTGTDQEALMAAFDNVENQEMHAETHAKYLELADDLAKRLGVPRSTSAATTSCCHHAAARS
jgi:hemerythrin-like domain-containing protein